MQFLDFFINEVSQQAAEQEIDPNLLIECLDLTSLNNQDNEAIITQLCEQALDAGVAAVCIYPQFVALAKSIVQGSTVKVATVANFPKGNLKALTVLKAIDQALLAGADEIDVVIPYQDYIDHSNEKALKDFVFACKKEIGGKHLKTILESGAFENDDYLERVALVCLEGGSDFLKTSTGKIPQGASLKAAAIMLGALRSFGEQARGFKASGGVRQYQQAKEYFLLAQIIMGDNWVNPETFRIGASSLLADLQQRRTM